MDKVKLKIIQVSIVIGRGYVMRFTEFNQYLATSNEAMSNQQPYFPIAIGLFSTLGVNI